MHKYERLDQIYQEFPEIIDLIKTAQWVSLECYNLRKIPTRLEHALQAMRSAGKSIDNRNH